MSISKQGGIYKCGYAKYAMAKMSVIMDVYGNEYHSTSTKCKQYIERITALNNKITKARKLLLNDNIYAGDFKAIKVQGKYWNAFLREGPSATNI